MIIAECRLNNWFSSIKLPLELVGYINQFIVKIGELQYCNYDRYDQNNKNK